MYGEVPEELKEKIRDHYNKGQGSIQDYARVYKVPIEEVLTILNLDNLKTVEMVGDLVDETEMGKHKGEINAGEEVDVPFTIN